MNHERFEGHVAGQGEPLWNQSYYFNAYDPQTKAGCLIRIGLLEYAQQANSWLIAFQDGLPIFTRTNLQLPYIKERPAGGMHIAGMHVEVIEPLKKCRIRFDEGEFSLDLVWETLHSLADSIAMSAGESGNFSDDIAHVHLEGPCRVRGHMTVRGRRIEIDAHGFRDVAAGVRNWASLKHYRLAWPVFDDGRTFCGIRGVDTQGRSGYMRMYHDGERWLRVQSIEDHNDYELADPFAVKALRWAFTDETGKRQEVTGSPVFHWLFPQDDFVVCEQIMAYQLGDGTQGYGLCEGGFRLPWGGMA